MTIAIDDRAMSAAQVTRQLMARLLEENPEGWARLSELMATLALPPLRFNDGFRRRPVEIEISAGVWATIDAVAIEPNRLIFWHGENGTRREYVFPKAAGVPRWRVVELDRAAFYIEAHG